MHYASFGKRFVATFIDWTIFAFLSGSLSYLVTGTAIGDDAFHRVNTALFVLFYWIYSAALESSPKGGAIGKQIMGIRVTDMEGNRISFPKATLRYLTRLLSFFLAGFGCVMIFFTLKRQGLHDQLANTIVVNSK
jgi:uncharacterized RDD family membrane protein YckC